GEGLVAAAAVDGGGRGRAEMQPRGQVDRLDLGSAGEEQETYVAGRLHLRDARRDVDGQARHLLPIGGLEDLDVVGGGAPHEEILAVVAELTGGEVAERAQDMEEV